MTSQAFTEVDLLKKQLAEETKEKYALYKRVKELTEELEACKNKNIFNWNKSPEQDLVNMLITFFQLSAFFPLHLRKTMVEYIYNGKRIK